MNIIPTHHNLDSDSKKTTWGILSLLTAGLAALMILATAGCTHQSAGRANNADIAGTYTLASVDGKQLPYTIKHEGSPTIHSGSFLINPDGTCASTMSFSIPSGQQISKETKATYTRTGDRLAMKWEGAGTTSGTVRNGTFEMENEGTLLTFKK